MQITAIVLAAGLSLRFSRPDSFTGRGWIPPYNITKIIKAGRSQLSKPLAKINSVPLIIYCLKILSSHPYIKEIIVVANRLNKKSIAANIKKYKIPKIKTLILGGLRRQDSVYNGLKSLSKNTDLVLIHDAARPFVDKPSLAAVIGAAKRYGAAILGVPVEATIKRVSKCQSVKVSRVKETLNRENLWEIQTPQVFKRDLIIRAYEKFRHQEVTDDAGLVEKLGFSIAAVKGSPSNIKITTPEDLLIAEAILKVKSAKRKA